MTATCSLCGHVVRVESAGMIIDPGTDPAAAAAVAEISLFDRLAGRMSQHLEEHRDQSAEMVAVMHLAAKVYAMTWAESKDEEPEYSALREAWRTGILTMMQNTSKPVAVYDDQAAAAAADSGAAVIGSKAQKSVRKDSN